MYDISYNGTTARELGLVITARPAILPAEEEVEKITVAGRDGILTGKRRLLPVTFNIEFGFREKPLLWSEQFRQAKMWLRGEGTLTTGDDKEWFYKVHSIRFLTAERLVKKIGKLTAQFTCDPYVYRVDGLEEYSISDEKVLTNLYAECHPTYIFAGSGTQTLTVNGNTVTVTGSGAAVVDTDRMITYMQTTGGLANTRLSGDYEDLYLQEGANTITSSGGVTIIPNWRSR